MRWIPDTVVERVNYYWKCNNKNVLTYLELLLLKFHYRYCFHTNPESSQIIFYFKLHSISNLNRYLRFENVIIFYCNKQFYLRFFAQNCFCRIPTVIYRIHTDYAAKAIDHNITMIKFLVWLVYTTAMS